MKLERISFTLDDLLRRADALMLGATKQALAVPRREKIHRIQRTDHHEATCTCGLWSSRTDVEEAAIAQTFAKQHASGDKESTKRRRRGNSDAA